MPKLTQIPNATIYSKGKQQGSAVALGKYTQSALRPGDEDKDPHRPAREFIGLVAANDWVNKEYRRIVLKVHANGLRAYAGQMFHILCPSPDGAEVWMRRPMSIYRVDNAAGQLEFLYKVEGRGTEGLASLRPGDELDLVGPLGIGFKLQPAWQNIVVLGRGVGLATLAPLSQLAAESGVGVTAILSARRPDLVMSRDLFEGLGARTITLVDTDGSSAVENVARILERLVDEGRADAFFTCGSNRLLKLMQSVGKTHNIPGQVAMEQIMVCGFGACYVCVRTFMVDGQKVLRRVCREGPVFNIQEAVGW
jgi:dihydroorotate dehydrogenase electron transfer subunit